MADQPRSVLDGSNFDTAIRLRWALRDIKARRTALSTISQNDLMALTELGLIEMREGTSSPDAAHHGELSLARSFTLRKDNPLAKGELTMRILLAVALIMAVPAAATAADDRSSDSGSPVGRPRTFIYEQFPGEGQAWIDNYQYDRAIREQEREGQKQWTDYARKHALPIARPDEAPIENEGPIAEKAPGDSGPTNTQEPGFRVVHPPETTSSSASDKVPDLAERFSFDGPPPRRRERLW